MAEHVANNHRVISWTDKYAIGTFMEEFYTKALVALAERHQSKAFPEGLLDCIFYQKIPDCWSTIKDHTQGSSYSFFIRKMREYWADSRDIKPVMGYMAELIAKPRIFDH